jgi:hypothetical protein
MDAKINQLLNELATERFTAEANGNAARRLLDRVREDPEYNAYSETEAMAKKRIADLIAKIQVWAEKEYATTKNKRVHPKIELAAYKTFSVKNAKRLYAWVRDNYAVALVVDEKEVKAYALKHPDEVDGVDVGTEYRVRIASDLT